VSAGVVGVSATRARVGTWFWLANRIAALVLAVCVVVHLATMIVAVQGGLSAAEILARTRGSAAWAAFYGAFVIAVAIHAPIGLRTVLVEWCGVTGRVVDALMTVFAVALLAGGMMAVAGVTR
jgi:fumarate reductase subunit C